MGFHLAAGGPAASVPAHEPHPLAVSLRQGTPSRYVLLALASDPSLRRPMLIARLVTAHDLLDKLLQFDPSRRLDCTSALHQ